MYGVGVDHVVCGPDIPKYVSLAGVRWWAAGAGWEVTALDCRIWSPPDQDQGWFHLTTYHCFIKIQAKVMKSSHFFEFLP